MVKPAQEGLSSELAEPLDLSTARRIARSSRSRHTFAHDEHWTFPLRHSSFPNLTRKDSATHQFASSRLASVDCDRAPRAMHRFAAILQKAGEMPAWRPFFTVRSSGRRCPDRFLFQILDPKPKFPAELQEKSVPRMTPMTSRQSLFRSPAATAQD